MIDLNAPIVPGRMAAGIALGDDLGVLLAKNVPERQESLPNCIRFLDFGSVVVWAKDQVIYRIGVTKNYTGTLARGIGIGSKLGELVRNNDQDILDTEDLLAVRGQLGWVFETEEWRSEKPFENLNAQLSGIYVFAPTTFASLASRALRPDYFGAMRVDELSVTVFLEVIPSVENNGGALRYQLFKNGLYLRVGIFPVHREVELELLKDERSSRMAHT